RPIIAGGEMNPSAGRNAMRGDVKRALSHLAILWLFTAVSLGVVGAETAATNLPLWIAQFDATVLPATERQAAARMVAEDVQRRLRAANERSSGEWKSVINREEWEQFRAAKLTALRESLGQPASPVPLRPRVTGTLGGEGYRIENVVFQSRLGLWVTANLYRPEKARP